MASNPSKPDADPKLTKRQGENLRASILGKAHKYVGILDACVAGEVELKPTQVKAAQILLDRVVPTMQSIDQTNHTDQPELSPDELDSLLTKAVQDLARKDPEKLQAMLNQPKLVAVK